MPRGLSLLPPELVMNILQFLSSARDLYTIIETSSHLYRIFGANKQSILPSILLNAIPTEVEADFILAYRAQRIWKFVPEHNTSYLVQLPTDLHTNRNRETFKLLKRESVDILDRFESRNVECLSEVVSDRSLVLDIWSLYCNFEYFMVSYSTRALSFYRTEEPLSFTERTRLQRAFFRWEIYTCLFRISSIFCEDTRNPALPTDPAPKFTEMLCPWEVEEISCVAQFYKTLVEELSDRIEDDFVTLVKNKMDTRLISEETKDELVEVGYILDWVSLLWFDESEKRSRRSGHNEYLVSKGIRYVRKLTNAPFQIARRMVVRSDIEARSKIPMLLGLQVSTSRTAWEWEKNKGELERTSAGGYCNSEGLGRCNFGCRWAVGNMARVILYAPANYELRNRGYVFWDKARMQKSKEFRSPRGFVGDFYKFPSSYQEHSERPGVETKLKGFPVHWKVISEISDEIDGLKFDGDDEV